MNAAKGHDKGNGTSWSETTIDSGGTVKLQSGRDTTLTGAQVNGDKVIADVGRDLTLASQQDSNRYDSKQTSFGAGGSFTFGSMTGSGYLNLSQDKMHSTFDSVAEQSGIYAGKGGFDITVGNHTQLDGAVIASQAQADKNRLDTGTLGFSDINNEADYKVSHSGGGISAGASMLKNVASNLASNVMAGVGSSGHAQGTTQAAVSDGAIVIRDQANQQQNVADLSRDVENANDAISPIFNKEKEQNRLQTVQLMGEIGSQVSDIVKTQGELNALQKAKEKYGELPANATEEKRQQWLDQLKNSPEYKDELAKSGTGSDLQRGIQAATAALTGLAGGNMNAALAGAAAPYLAEQVKKQVGEDNIAANAIAHAIVGGVVAELSGGNGLAGAAGAASGELAARALMAEMYPGKTASQLSEEEKQKVSALATLAAGLAGGLAGDNTASALAGAQTGKNAVENNLLNPGHDDEELEREHGNRLVKVIKAIPGLGPLLDDDGYPIPGTLGVGPGGVPIRSVGPLPSGYTPTGNSNVIGPKGGIYTNSGKTEPLGNVIYSNNGSYYTFDNTSKNAIPSLNPVNQIRQNYEQGKAFEDSKFQEYAKGMTDTAREVTIKTGSGVNVRVDIMTKDSDGNIFCIECKSSATAPPTPNQKIGYPEIEKHGGVISGAGKPGFEEEF